MKENTDMREDLDSMEERSVSCNWRELSWIEGGEKIDC
jgi:hypothetical protein